MTRREMEIQIANLEIECDHNKMLVNAEISENQRQIEAIDLQIQNLQIKKNDLCQCNRNLRTKIAKLALDLKVDKKGIMEELS